MKTQKEIIQALLDIGLSTAEAKIYLSVIKCGPANISQIADYAKIKRPSAYLYIDALIKRKMVLVNKKNPKRPLYYINDPKKVLDQLKFNVNRFTTIFPDLRNLSMEEFSPYVEIYEGFEGMKKIYVEALSTSWKEEVLVYGTISAEKTNEHDVLYKLWLKMIKQKKVHMREILDHTADNYEYLKKIEKLHNKHHQIKLIPQNFEFLPHKMKLLEADNIIFNNKIAFFSSYERNLYVIVITHKHIYRIYKDLFEMAWEVANDHLK